LGGTVVTPGVRPDTVPYIAYSVGAVNPAISPGLPWPGQATVSSGVIFR